MDYKSLFQTSLRILGRNKLIWLFSLLFTLLFFSLFGLYLLIPKSLAVLVCCLSLINLYLIIAAELGILLILYHAYLGETVNFSSLGKEINSYFLRVLGIFLLEILAIIIPVLVLYVSFRNLPYIFNEIVSGISIFYYFTFFFTYLQLGVFIKKFDIKYAATVRSYNRGAKFVIAILFTITHILFTHLLPAVIQRGFSIGILTISYQDMSAINSHLIPRIVQALYSWIIFPITTAVVVSLYFKDRERVEGVPQSGPQTDSTLKPLQ